MHVFIQSVRQFNIPREALHRDGWNLEDAGGDSVLASHPQVSNEEMARSRLSDLSLLTAGSLRIEFRQDPLPGRSRGLKAFR